MPYELVPTYYPAGTNLRELDGDETCPHNDDPFECRICADDDEYQRELAAEQRADARNDCW